MNLVNIFHQVNLQDALIFLAIFFVVFALSFFKFFWFSQRLLLSFLPAFFIYSNIVSSYSHSLNMFGKFSSLIILSLLIIASFTAFLKVSFNYSYAKIYNKALISFAVSLFILLFLAITISPIFPGVVLSGALTNLILTAQYSIFTYATALLSFSLI